MIKKVIATSLVTAALVFSACGGSSDGESQLETQQMLDEKDYAGVISKLESSASTTSDYLALAAAYMGKAGFSLSSIIGIVATSADSGDNNTFAAFIENSKEKSNSQSLNDMNTAVSYYNRVVLNTKCSDKNASLSGAQSDVCLYTGLSQISQTAVAMSYIADDVSVLGDKSGSDDKLTASTCAMQYAFDGNTTSSSECSFSSESNITFASGITYGDITITVNGKLFEHLITPAGNTNNRSTALTQGYCSVTDFSTRVDDKNSSDYQLSYHVCPIDENSQTSTTSEDILVDALNNGSDSIGTALPDDTTKEDVDQFKKDVLKSSGRENDTNTTITTEDIINYLNENNK